MNFCKTTGCYFAACALAATLGACGGGFDDEDATLLFQAAAPAAAPTTRPLLQRDGTPSAPLPQAVPRRGDEMTFAGLYALRAQARALERAFAGQVVWVDEACCHGDGGSNDVDLAFGLVAGEIAARDLNAKAPLFEGSELAVTFV